MFSRLKPFLFPAGLGLLYFCPLLLHPTYVLYADHSDLLATFLPVKHFLVRSWQETGAVPLWCPYSFGGMPLIHDVQVAAFYPFHLPLYVLPEEWLGAAMSWLVVAHVIIAGGCMVAYSRSQGLEQTPALVAAVGYMFAGKWLLHILEAGHYVLIPLAWLPLVLLWLERAIRQRSVVYATWAGTVFALIVLGTHPQMTFFAGLFVVLWTAGNAGAQNVQSEAPEEDRAPVQTLHASRFRMLTRWLVLGAWTAVVAAALSAVQLIPALEAASESTRAAGVAARDAAAVALPSLFGLLGPAWNGGWEDRGSLGVLWVTAAIAAPLLCGRQVRFQAGVCLLLVAYAAGGAALVQWLPGFRLFQLPVRMLMLLALPIALLAGKTTQALLAETPPPAPVRTVYRRVLVWVLGAALALTASAASSDTRAWQHVYWDILLVGAVLTFWLLGNYCPLRRPAWAGVWFAVLLADAWGLTWANVAVRSPDEIYAPSACVRFLAEAQQRAPHERWRVLDRGLHGEPSSAPLGAALPMFGNVQVEPVLGYNPFDLRRYKEYLQFIIDEDGPIRPREGIFGYPIIQGFPIRNKALLDLLGTRYVLQPADGASQFHAAGEPGENESWQRVGPEDLRPRVFSFLAGGVQQLPPYSIYENRDAFPRAFLVQKGVPLAERTQALAQLKVTDFQREVLLEDAPGERDATPSPAKEPGLASIRGYRPNRVDVDVRNAPPGYLVLTDVWFPGWTCTVDGHPAPIYRANFLFRAVAIPAGNHDVVFVFQPASYRWGRYVTAVALIGVVCFSLLFRCSPKRLG